MSRISFEYRRVNDWCVDKKQRQQSVSAPAPSQPPARIVHPVIASPKYTTPFRVTRRFVTPAGDDTELIGETRTLAEALTIARTEQWAAFVTDKNGRQVHFNFQPVERRSA